MDSHTIRFLSAADVQKSLSMGDAIEAMREAFIELSSGRANVPPRVHMNIAEENATELFMPVYLPSIHKIGVKVVSVFADNPARGLPLIHALVAVFDGKSGVPVAVMDGEYLTALRTGAASGLATDLLARKDAAVVTVFGAGRQGRSQLEAVAAVRKIQRAYIINRGREKAAIFAAEMQSQLGLEVIVAESKHILEETDIICTATTSANPVFSDGNLKPGVHINAIGSYKPSTSEIPAATIVRAKVVVDSFQSCIAEAGDLILPIEQGLIGREHIYAELGEIAAGNKKGRASEGEITVFKSVGNAVQDLAAAARVLDAAQKLKLGVEVKL
jgi:ornithine cyclodeaminase/alanine dehydrogenase-like protein (mu-crystallin family)